MSFSRFEVLPEPDPPEQAGPQPLPGPATFSIKANRRIKLPGNNELDKGQQVGYITLEYGLDPADVCRTMNRVFGLEADE